MEELQLLVKNMKLKDHEEKDNVINKITNANCFTEKCVYARQFLAPQSTDLENIIKKDLGIEDPNDEISGDGCKNGINYEIKSSVHAKDCKLNFVQLRPDHKIDYYIFACYNMYHDDKIGKAFLLKIPAKNVNDMIVHYGGYAHGTCQELGKITLENLKGRNCEYAIRCNPNCKKGKNAKLWKVMLSYEVEYTPDNF